MTYIPVTPFRRTVDAAVLKHQAQAGQPLPPHGINKWEALRELAAARVAFGLSDRDIAVLQALVSFHPGAILGEGGQGTVVHPSNRAICDRLAGMPCSTMRRHLSRLVATGVVIRRDSPNGKRYARRYGDDKVAYGFDLAPLVLRMGEFCAAAEAVRAGEERVRRLRETVSLMRRDLAGLAAYGADLRPDLDIWDAFSDRAALTARALRRKLDMDALQAMEAELRAALDTARGVLEPMETEIMSTSDAPSGQHHQNSKEDSQDPEPRLETARGGTVVPLPDRHPALDEEQAELDEGPPLPVVPLGLVLTACTEFLTYCERPVRHWHDLVTAADVLRPMLGIAPSAWDEAKRVMGPETAAVVVVAMLERVADIRSPGGYLRVLTDKAAAGAFSCGPMVMALLRRNAA